MCYEHFKMLGLCLIFLFIAVCAYADDCTTDPTSGDQTCINGNYSYTIPSQATLNAEAVKQAIIDTQNNKPENKFNKDLFDGQLGQTSLANNPVLLTYVGALDRFIDFKNFQAIANLIVALFQGGEMTKDEVDTFVGVMSNQQINLVSYNSEINAS